MVKVHGQGGPWAGRRNVLTGTGCCRQLALSNRHGGDRGAGRTGLVPGQGVVRRARLVLSLPGARGEGTGDPAPPRQTHGTIDTTLIHPGRTKGSAYETAPPAIIGAGPHRCTPASREGSSRGRPRPPRKTGSARDWSSFGTSPTNGVGPAARGLRRNHRGAGPGRGWTCWSTNAGRWKARAGREHPCPGGRRGGTAEHDCAVRVFWFFEDGNVFSAWSRVTPPSCRCCPEAFKAGALSVWSKRQQSGAGAR